jgi:hypothetical protein
MMFGQDQDMEERMERRSIAEQNERELPAEQDDPHDVAEHRRHARAAVDDDAAAERPQRVAGEAERRDAERDRDDQDAGEGAGDGVGERQPPAGEDEPQDVPEKPDSRPGRRRSAADQRGVPGDGLLVGEQRGQRDPHRRMLMLYASVQAP